MMLPLRSLTWSNVSLRKEVMQERNEQIHSAEIADLAPELTQTYQ